jgi:AraC-like DNA-binding protein
LDSSTYERIGINIKKTTLERLSTKRSRLLNCFENHPIGENNLIHLNPDQLDEYITLCTNLKQALNSNYYGQDILSDAYLAQLLVFINTLYHTTINSYNNIMPELVSNTMFYIRNHLTEDITLKDLSSEFSYNGTYISYLFKQHTGLTLRAYILDQRLTLAKRILSEGKSVTDACEASGFRDYSNFIRTFTKEIGMSPGRYRHAKSTIT